MYKEEFLNLIEIQSLQKKMEGINQSIEGQKRRILDLEGQLKARENSAITSKNELNQIDQLIKDKELTLLKTEKKLLEVKRNQNNVTSEKQAKALQDEIFSLELLKKELEEQILINLEKQELLSEEISNFENFKNGVLKSILEIQKEADQKIQLEGKNLSLLKEREGNLFSILPKNFQDIFSIINKKFKANSLAYIENSKCGSCGMAVPSMTCQEVESGNVLETCPSCGRILLPHQ